MKRLVIFSLLFFGILFSVFSATKDEQTKNLSISWTPVSESNPGKYELSFLDGLNGSAVDTLVLETSEESTGTNLTGKGTVYLKWDIITNSNVKIYLKSEALKSTTPAASLNWEAEITEEETGSKSEVVIGKFGGVTDSAVYSETAAVSYAISNGYGDTGTIKLDITTANAATKPPATYTTTLTAIMKSGE